MLDYRYYTFITLCKTKSFTKTAELLNMTQPAVSQHIKYLQDRYHCDLFTYESKKLNLTQKGEMLYQFTNTCKADIEKFETNLTNIDVQSQYIHFGATLTIGEYLMPKVIKNLCEQASTLKISMEVDNTESLLTQLNDGILDFALIEGYFDKTKYDSKVLMDSSFIAVCSPKSKYANKDINIEDLLSNCIITRENGSGSKDILDQFLHQNGLNITNFKHTLEIGNISAIKECTSENLGITFIYEIAVEEELKNNKLAPINVKGLPITRQFNFVYLKNSKFENDVLSWYNQIKKIV